jgi:hypothetical protein
MYNEEKSLQDLLRLSLWGVGITVVGGAVLLVVLKLFWLGLWLGIGFLLGGLLASANIQLLGRAFLPMIHANKSSPQAIGYGFLSLLGMALALYAVSKFNPFMLFGAALGLAIPLAIGIVHTLDQGRS